MTATGNSPYYIPPYDLASIFSPYACIFDTQTLEVETVDFTTTPKIVPIALEEKPFPTRQTVEARISQLESLSSNEPLSIWLIRAAGLVDDATLLEALELTKTSSLSIGEILRLAGRLTYSDLRAIDHATRSANAGTIHKRFAAIALSFACQSYVEYDDALWNLGFHPSEPFFDSALAILLEDVGVINDQQLRKIKSETLSNGQSLGLTIVRKKVLSSALLKVFLECLSAVSNHQLDYRILTQTIKQVFAEQGTKSGAVSPEAEIVHRLKISHRDRTLGNLLLGSELLGLDELLYSLEMSLDQRRPLVDVLEGLNLVNSILLDGASALTHLLLTKQMTARRCAELMAQARTTGRSLKELANSEDIAVTRQSFGGLDLAITPA